MLFNWDVNRNPEVVLGKVLEAFATGICVLAVQNRSSEMLQIGPILSVHLRVCLSVCLCHFLAAGFWTDSEQNSFVIS